MVKASADRYDGREFETEIWLSSDFNFFCFSLAHLAKDFQAFSKK